MIVRPPVTSKLSSISHLFCVHARSVFRSLSSPLTVISTIVQINSFRKIRLVMRNTINLCTYKRRTKKKRSGIEIEMLTAQTQCRLIHLRVLHTYFKLSSQKKNEKLKRDRPTNSQLVSATN